MAGLIVKSPYLKCGGGSSVSGYLRYIGTRERVEIIPDDRPPTRKQEQLITKLTKDFPEAKELGEYSDYKDKPTKANASVFITRALEENWFQVQQSDGYMKYIATRPRAERLGDHGLFGDEDAVDLEKTMRELDQYSGNVWTHILSLKREDAARLGYDNAKAWRNLLRANRNDIAAAMNIQPNHFHWYAAFHDEGKHPPCPHDGAERIRLGEISFEDDGISQTDEPEHVRNESQACRELWRIIRNEDISLDYRDRAAEKLEQVAERGDAYAQYRMGQLYRDGPLLIPDNHKAKHWLSQAAKQGLPEAQYALGKLLLSDDWEVRDPDEGIHWLKQAAENGSHFAAYRLGKEYLDGNAVNKDTSRAADWFTKSAEAGNQYAQYMLGKLYLMGQGLPRDQAQATVWFSRSAAQGNQYAQFFLEQRNNLRPPSVMLAVTQLLYHISRIFEDNSVPSAVPVGQQVDRKLRRKIQEKKIAMGHKPDDHEEQWPEMTM